MRIVIPFILLLFTHFSFTQEKVEVDHNIGLETGVNIIRSNEQANALFHYNFNYRRVTWNVLNIGVGFEEKYDDTTPSYLDYFQRITRLQFGLGLSFIESNIFNLIVLSNLNIAVFQNKERYSSSTAYTFNTKDQLASSNFNLELLISPTFKLHNFCISPNFGISHTLFEKDPLILIFALNCSYRIKKKK